MYVVEHIRHSQSRDSMWFLKAMRSFNYYSTINFAFIYSFVSVNFSLEAAQATITLPSPEELHENSAPTVSTLL